MRKLRKSFILKEKEWWVVRGSNSRHLRCKRSDPNVSDCNTLRGTLYIYRLNAVFAICSGSGRFSELECTSQIVGGMFCVERMAGKLPRLALFSRCRDRLRNERASSFNRVHSPKHKPVLLVKCQGLQRPPCAHAGMTRETAKAVARIRFMLSPIVCGVLQGSWTPHQRQ